MIISGIDPGHSMPPERLREDASPAAGSMSQGQTGLYGPAGLFAEVQYDAPFDFIVSHAGENIIDVFQFFR